MPIAPVPLFNSRSSASRSPNLELKPVSQYGLRRWKTIGQKMVRFNGGTFVFLSPRHAFHSDVGYDRWVATHAHTPAKIHIYAHRLSPDNASTARARRGSPGVLYQQLGCFLVCRTWSLHTYTGRLEGVERAQRRVTPEVPEASAAARRGTR